MRHALISGLIAATLLVSPAAARGFGGPGHSFGAGGAGFRGPGFRGPGPGFARGRPFADRRFFGRPGFVHDRRFFFGGVFGVPYAYGPYPYYPYPYYPYPYYYSYYPAYPYPYPYQYRYYY